MAEVYKTLTCAGLYHIWKERNDRRFRGKSKTSEQLALSIFNKVSLYLNRKLEVALGSPALRSICEHLKVYQNRKYKEIKTCAWMRPERDEIMLNADGSVDAVSHAHGGVLHDSEGLIRLIFAGNEGNPVVLE